MPRFADALEKASNLSLDTKVLKLLRELGINVSEHEPGAGAGGLSSCA